MNETNKLMNKARYDQEQTAPWSGCNITTITPGKKRHHHHRQQNTDKAQIYVWPLIYTRPQIHTSADNLPIHIRILLVEENARERQACRKALQHSTDFTIDLTEVTSGEAGLQLASQEKFDCVLLDYQLPDMSGMEFLGRLTNLVAGSLPPVLKLIASDKPQLAADAVKQGLHDYLIKDSNGHYLKWLPVLIQRMLENQRMAQEKHRIEAMYRSLVEHIPAITYIASLRNGNQLLYVSPQIEQLGYLSDNWLTDPSQRFQCIYEEDRAMVEQAFAHSCNNGELFRCEYRMLGNNGKLHWFLDEARPIKNPGGQTLFLQGVMIDITEMKSMENELHSHRYFLEKRVTDRTKQLEKRLTILESCNSELCNQLEKERRTSRHLRKTMEQVDVAPNTTAETNMFGDALVS